jgi:hypothetical protein
MLHPGHRLGDRYRLDAQVRAGGMGEVWQAVDDVLGRVVAVTGTDVWIVHCIGRSTKGDTRGSVFPPG